MAKTAPAIIFFNDYSIWSALELASMGDSPSPIVLLTTLLESAISSANGEPYKSKNKIDLWKACKKQADTLGVDVAEYIEGVARVNLVKEDEKLPKDASLKQKSLLGRISEALDLNRDAQKATA